MLNTPARDSLLNLKKENTGAKHTQVTNTRVVSSSHLDLAREATRPGNLKAVRKQAEVRLGGNCRGSETVPEGKEILVKWKA